MSTDYQAAYPRRIVTFIDILGFTRDVRNLGDGVQFLIPIEAVLRHIANCKRDIDGARSNGLGRHDARMTSFSDCVVLSYKLDPEAAARALWDAALLGRVMLRAGFLPRGAITSGRLWHDENSVFGEGFLAAYDLERDKAVTPRILVCDEPMELARKFLGSHEGPESEQSCFRDDGDGCYLHILSKDWSFLRREREEEEAGKYEPGGVQEMFKEIHAMLPIRFLQADTDKQRHKIEWMRDYVNRAIDEHQLPAALKVSLRTPGSSGVSR